MCSAILSGKTLQGNQYCFLYLSPAFGPSPSLHHTKFPLFTVRIFSVRKPPALFYSPCAAGILADITTVLQFF